jgi:Tol biopolymer transport system component
MLAIVLLKLGPNPMGGVDILQELKVKQKDEGLVIAMVWGKEIFTISLDGKTVTKKLNTTAYFYGAKFSSNGEQFVGFTDQGLIIMDLDANILWRMNRIRSAWNIAWSSDGTKIAFEGTDSSSGFTGLQFIIVNPKELHQVSREGKNPSWSEDGSKLAYAENGKILIYDINSKSSLSLTTGVEPSWSPDGNWLAYKSANSEFYLMDRSGKAIKKLFSGKKVLTPLRWSPDSQYLMYVKEGSKKLLDLSLDCLEPKQIIVHRVRDGKERSIHQICKASPYDFVWVRNKSIESWFQAHRY